MAKFPDPPLRTGLHKVAPSRENPEGVMSEGWQRHFIGITNRLTQPNIPVVTSLPTTGKQGDLRLLNLAGSFSLAVCVQDTPTVIWKKAVLS